MRARADVVVVGGGIVGSACAYALARRGARVVLVERADLAAGASGRNHGLLLTPLDPVLVPMAKASTALYEEVAGRSPVPFHLDRERIGLLVAPTGPDREAEARSEAEAAEATGVRAEWLEGPALRELEPELGKAIRSAWLLDDGHRLDPAGLTVALALLARDHGAEVRRHEPVRSFITEDGSVRGVVTDEGPIRAGAVVVAAGPWSVPLLAPLAQAVPVTGARGWLVQLGPVSGRIRHLVAAAGWHLLPAPEPLPPVTAGDVARAFPPPEVGALVQPNPDGTILVGGSRQPVVTAEPEDPEVPRRILAMAIGMLPILARAPVLSAWWGIRPVTPDGRPIVGLLADGLVVATGHGSQGVILGGGTGALVAAMLSGEDMPFEPEPFRPDRFGARAAP